MTQHPPKTELAQALRGSLLGLAVGDALGLPYEGMSRQRAQRTLGPPDRHRTFFGRGLVSDDTEHTCIVAQALLASNGDETVFARQLRSRLRWWLAALPAGTGRATAVACLRMWIGYSAKNSGVWSAGNGPAMRAALLGLTLSDPQRLRSFIRISARITHRDPKAEWGALAVAIAAQISSLCLPHPDELAGRLSSRLASFVREESDPAIQSAGDELLGLLDQAARSARAGKTTQHFAEQLGWSRGVSGYMFATVPVCIHAWLTHPQCYRSAIVSVIHCGGDTDTTAAIVGGIVGAGTGVAGIPDDWLAGLKDWPLTKAWMDRLASQLARHMETGTFAAPPERAFPAQVVRNLVFWLIALTHVAWRGARWFFPRPPISKPNASSRAGSHGDRRANSNR